MPEADTVGKPEYFYKYTRLGEYTEGMIAKNEIFFQSPGRLNDPFDCGGCFTLDADDEVREEYANRLFANNSSVTEEQKERYRRLWLEQLINAPEDAQKRIDQFYDDVRKDGLGVYSMSEKKDNILMWAHYADNHKGICLEYDSQSPPFRKLSKKVIYRRELPVMAFFQKPFIIAGEQLLIKAEDWSYEAEWRMLSLSSGTRYCGRRALNGVILGMNITDEDEAKVREYIKKSNRQINLYRAERKTREYGLDIVLIK